MALVEPDRRLHLLDILVFADVAARDGLKFIQRHVALDAHVVDVSSGRSRAPSRS